MKLVLGDLGFGFCVTFWMLMWKFLRFSWFLWFWRSVILCGIMIPGVGGFGSWD